MSFVSTVNLSIFRHDGSSTLLCGVQMDTDAPRGGPIVIKLSLSADYISITSPVMAFDFHIAKYLALLIVLLLNAYINWY